MLFVLGIVKISTGPRTLHIIFNTGSTASRAHSFDAQVRARFESEGWRSQVSQLPAPASELCTYTALVLVANHYINTRVSVSPVCVDIRAPALSRTRSNGRGIHHLGKYLYLILPEWFLQIKTREDKFVAINLTKLFFNYALLIIIQKKAYHQGIHIYYKEHVYAPFCNHISLLQYSCHIHTQEKSDI